MKRITRILGIIAISAVIVIGFIACPVNPTTYTVTFDSDGGSTVQEQKVTEGNKVNKPGDPSKDGFTFVYWFNTANDIEWDFDSDVVTANITLKAKWQAISGPVLNYTALNTAITSAGTAKTGVTVSIDGSDVAPTDKWVTQAAMDALNTAIATAETAKTQSTTQAQVDNAVTALNNAINAFNNSKEDGTQELLDYTDLDTAIADANDAKVDVIEADNGSDIVSVLQWVTPEDMAFFEDAIEAAETARAAATTQVQIDSSAEALNDAIDAFNDAKQNGEVEVTEEFVLAFMEEFTAILTEYSMYPIVISIDGSDISPDKYWVTEEERNAWGAAAGILIQISMGTSNLEWGEAYLIFDNACQILLAALKPGTAVPLIVIEEHPEDKSFMMGKISGSLSVTATVKLANVVQDEAVIGYQWYSNTLESNVGGTAIDGATEASFTIPTNLTINTYYYFVELTSTNTETVRSNVAKVDISPSADATFAFYWANQQNGILYGTDGAGTNGAFTLSRGSAQTLTITADPDDEASYTNQRWYIGNTLQVVSNNEPSFTFSSVGRPNGTYLINLIVDADGASYSRTFTVTVTN